MLDAIKNLDREYNLIASFYILVIFFYAESFKQREGRLRLREKIKKKFLGDNKMYQTMIEPQEILPWHDVNYQRLSDMLLAAERGWKPEPIYAFPLIRQIEGCSLGVLDGHHRRVISKIRGLPVEAIVIETSEEANKILSYRFDEKRFREVLLFRTEMIASKYQEIAEQTSRLIDSLIKKIVVYRAIQSN